MTESTDSTGGLRGALRDALARATKAEGDRDELQRQGIEVYAMLPERVKAPEVSLGEAVGLLLRELEDQRRTAAQLLRAKQRLEETVEMQRDASAVVREISQQRERIADLEHELGHARREALRAAEDRSSWRKAAIETEHRAQRAEAQLQVSENMPRAELVRALRALERGVQNLIDDIDPIRFKEETT